MFNYAQLDDAGIVITVASLSGEVASDTMIKVDSYAPMLLGKRYNAVTYQFEEVIDAH